MKQLTEKENRAGREMEGRTLWVWQDPTGGTAPPAPDSRLCEGAQRMMLKRNASCYRDLL